MQLRQDVFKDVSPDDPPRALKCSTLLPRQQPVLVWGHKEEKWKFLLYGGRGGRGHYQIHTLVLYKIPRLHHPPLSIWRAEILFLPPPLACLPEHTNSYKHNTHTYVPKQVIFGKSKSANKEGTARNSKVSLATYDAVEGLHDPGAKRKKGKGAAGMAKKFAKRRVK